LVHLEWNRNKFPPRGPDGPDPTSKREKRNVDRTREYNFLAGESQVEFFHSKVPLMDDSGRGQEITSEKINVKGLKPGDEQWVWVTGSSRIQVSSNLSSYKTLRGI